MAERTKARIAFKFLFWTTASAVLVFVVIRSHTTGEMAGWYYYTAALDGYAVNAKSFKTATRDNPAFLTIGSYDRIEGLQAVKVSKGDRLPSNATGIIADAVLKTGKRAVLEGGQIKVLVPWEILDAKGFKFKDTFQHKGIKTYPWAAVWNLLMVIGLGIALGFMAEGFTDFLGIKITKLRHFEGH